MHTGFFHVFILDTTSVSKEILLVIPINGKVWQYVDEIIGSLSTYVSKTENKK